MNILHLSNVVGKRGGGISEVVESLTHYQNNKKKVRADLWFPGNHELLEEVHISSKIDKNRLKNLDSIGDAKYGITPGLLKYRGEVIQTYDLIHQHGVWLPYSAFTASIAKKKRIIINPHGLLEEEKFQISYKKKKMAYFLFEKRNLERVSCFVACSDQEAEGLRSFGVTQPIAIIPNGVKEDLQINEYSKTYIESFKKQYQIDEHQQILLFLSRIHPFKGLELFIRTLSESEFDNWVLVIAGIDENGHTEELKEIVKKLNLERKVIFIGPVFGKQKITVLDAADCFILPSINENFGIVVGEALSRGIPVIATKRTPWKDLETYNCGWWVERSKEGFSRVLKEVSNTSTDELLEKGQRGKKLVEEKFTWPKVSEQYLSLYSWVLNNFDSKFLNGFELYND